MDGGSSWTVLQAAASFGFLHADMHALALASDGSKLYLGNDGGAYSTTQITAANPVFKALNSTLATAQFYPRLSIDPAKVANAIGFVFVALPLTAFGFPSYPLSPNNSRLLWDRLAMTIALMSMVAARSADKRRGGKPHWGAFTAHSIVSERECAFSGVESQ